ncbi:uncharacterized protein LOC144241894 [Crocuta crocuta]
MYHPAPVSDFPRASVWRHGPRPAGPGGVCPHATPGHRRASEREPRDTPPSPADRIQALIPALRRVSRPWGPQPVADCREPHACPRPLGRRTEVGMLLQRHAEPSRHVYRPPSGHTAAEWSLQGAG